jgi:DNA-binding NarL/FixJ family response regulator
VNDAHRLGMPPSLRVLVADDRQRIRAALREHLEERGLIVCAEASDAAEALAAALGERPDVCLLAATPPIDAVATAERIVHAAPAVRVVLLGPSPSDDGLLAAARVGASGYLAEDAAPRLVPALRDVAAGRPAFPARLNTLLFDVLRTRASNGAGAT